MLLALELLAGLLALVLLDHVGVAVGVLLLLLLSVCVMRLCRLLASGLLVIRSDIILLLLLLLVVAVSCVVLCSRNGIAKRCASGLHCGAFTPHSPRLHATLSPTHEPRTSACSNCRFSCWASSSEALPDIALLLLLTQLPNTL